MDKDRKVTFDDYDFKSVQIPKEIWFTKELSSIEKLVYTESL